MSYALIAKNGLWLIIGRIISIAFSFAAIAMIARIYGPELYGTLALAISVVTMVSPAIQLGLNSIVTRDLVNEPEEKNSILGTVLFLRVLGACTCILFSVILIWFDFRQEDNLLLFITLLLIGELFKSGLVFSFWLESKTLGKIHTFCGVVALLISSLLKVLAASFGVDFIYIIYLQVIEGGLIGGVYFISYLLLEDNSLKFNISVHRVLGYIRKCLPLIASSVTAVIYMKVDLVMIANFMDYSSVGVYAVASKISEVWFFVPIMIATASFPTLLKTKKQSRKKYQAYLQNIFDSLCIIGYIAVICIIAVGPYIISFVFGKEYLAATSILLIHVWGGVFMAMRALASKWILAEDVLIFSLLTQGSGAVANILLNYFLIPVYGLEGAAIATLLSYTIAGYLGFAFSSQTRIVFRMMSCALLSPITRLKKLAG